MRETYSNDPCSLVSLTISRDLTILHLRAASIFILVLVRRLPNRLGAGKIRINPAFA
jgi:hypothetical protein